MKRFILHRLLLILAFAAPAWMFANTPAAAEACVILFPKGTVSGFPNWTARNNCEFWIYAEVCWGPRRPGSCSADIIPNGKSRSFLDMQITKVDADGWYCPLREWQKNNCRIPTTPFAASAPPSNAPTSQTPDVPTPSGPSNSTYDRCGPGCTWSLGRCWC